jgi:hypothetical protein
MVGIPCQDETGEAADQRLDTHHSFNVPEMILCHGLWMAADPYVERVPSDTEQLTQVLTDGVQDLGVRLRIVRLV